MHEWIMLVASVEKKYMLTVDTGGMMATQLKCSHEYSIKHVKASITQKMNIQSGVRMATRGYFAQIDWLRRAKSMNDSQTLNV